MSVRLSGRELRRPGRLPTRPGNYPYWPRRETGAPCPDDLSATPGTDRRLGIAFEPPEVQFVRPGQVDVVPGETDESPIRR